MSAHNMFQAKVSNFLKNGKIHVFKHCQDWLPSPCQPVARISYSTKKVNVVQPLFLCAKQYSERIAIVDEDGSHTYQSITERCDTLTEQICDIYQVKNGKDIGGARISILTPNDSSYVVSQWATWQSGGVCVPLCDKHPQSEWQYFLEDSESSLVISTREFKNVLEPVTNKVGIPLHILDEETHSGKNFVISYLQLP